VTVPVGAVPGQQLSLQLHNGSIASVVIPPGVGAGQVFEVQVAAAPAPAATIVAPAEVAVASFAAGADLSPIATSVRPTWGLRALY
jgi:hypothetical protein